MQCDSGAAVYEFFAGGGLARLGLEPDWRVTFANDWDPMKARAYRAAFGNDHFRAGDIWALSSADLPGQAALAWASFPCQDLSLAGARGGLAAPRSGAFFGFHRLLAQLQSEGRAPPLVVIENVTGLISSRAGADLETLCAHLIGLGYQVGAVEIDAAAFVPQSRPRAFIIASRPAIPAALHGKEPAVPFHPPGLVAAVAAFDARVKERWIWWRLPSPPWRNHQLADIVDWDDPCGWRTPAETEAVLGLMHTRHRTRIDALRNAGGVHVGALFRRIRIENGVRVQRAEARFDGIAGCLRTPAGGSSRQTLIVIDNGAVRTRLISPREAARLMGVPDEYPLPFGQTAALKVCGDGVAVPVVRFLSQNLLTPLRQRQSAPAP